MSFLYTSNFEDISDALTSQCEGVVWQGAIPDEILSLVTSFDFSRFSTLNGKGYHRGRDALKRETTAVTWLGKKFPELSPVDEFAKEIKSQFEGIPKQKGRPRLGRWNSPPCHHISDIPITVPSTVPHVDGVSSTKLIRGYLGKEWIDKASPSHYPEIKAIATMNKDSTEATKLLPRACSGEADEQHACNYPNADLSEEETTKPGDVIILKKYVTLHRSPLGMQRRWVTTF